MDIELHETIKTIPIVLEEVQENHERNQLQIQPIVLPFVKADLLTSLVCQSDFQEHERSFLFSQDEEEVVITSFFVL